MARTIAEIKQEIFDNIALNNTLAGINSTSITAIYYRFIIVVCYAIYAFELILDNHNKEIDTKLDNQKAGRPNWYRDMALNFQYGFDLIPDTDKYDNTGFTQDQIDASKIIKYCSVKESSESARLIVKVAGESGGNLIQLTAPQLESFIQYIKEIRYGGVKLIVVNNPADKLLLNMAIYRDVLVIDADGNSILNGGKPVEKAIKAYMKALPFNGELVLNDLIEKLRAVDGVDNAHIINATSSVWDVLTSSYLPHQPINVKTIPVAGYFEIENFDNVTYVV